MKMCLELLKLQISLELTRCVLYRALMRSALQPPLDAQPMAAMGLECWDPAVQL
jgi:hypothetical protein